MEQDQTYYHDLIAKYFAGELAGEELAALSVWLKSEPANQKVFSDFQKAWEVVEKSKIEAIDTNSEWAIFKTRIPPSEEKVKETKIIQLQTKTSSRRIFLRQVVRIAAVLIILAGLTFIILNYQKQSPSQKQLVALNDKMEGTLPDGSVVTLNAGSTLDYPENFNGENRSVTLLGEAFFEITPDPSKPFIISANDLLVEVVGTSFSVNARSNGDVEVIVKTGKVAVYYKDTPSDRKLLEPGEKAEFAGETKKVTETGNEDENFISWKTNLLVFNDDSLSTVVNDLNKFYKTEITIRDENIKGRKLTGTYKDKSLDQILTLLESSLKIRVTKKSSSKIELSGDAEK